MCALQHKHIYIYRITGFKSLSSLGEMRNPTTFKSKDLWRLWRAEQSEKAMPGIIIVERIYCGGQSCVLIVDVANAFQ